MSANVPPGCNLVKNKSATALLKLRQHYPTEISARKYIVYTIVQSREELQSLVIIVLSPIDITT